MATTNIHYTTTTKQKNWRSTRFGAACKLVRSLLAAARSRHSSAERHTSVLLNFITGQPRAEMQTALYHRQYSKKQLFLYTHSRATTKTMHCSTSPVSHCHMPSCILFIFLANAHSSVREIQHTKLQHQKKMRADTTRRYLDRTMYNTHFYCCRTTAIK